MAKEEVFLLGPAVRRRKAERRGFGPPDECQRGCAPGGMPSLRLRGSPAAGCHCGCARRRRSRGACAGGFAGARGKFAPSARQPGRRRRRRREAEPGDHPPPPSPQSPHVPQPHLTSYPPSDTPNPGMAAPSSLPGRTSGRQSRL
nr:pH-response regulator protein palI/prr-5-like [Manis javanica]